VHSYDPATGDYQPWQFNRSGLGNARFSPLWATANPVPTLYLAETLESALMETVLHDVPWPSAGYAVDLQQVLDESTLCASQVVLKRPLQVVDLSALGLRPLGLRPSDLTETNADQYPRTRQWAQWFHAQLPQAQGLQWQSRQDNRRSAALLFGDREGMQQGALGVDGVEFLRRPIRDAAVLDALLGLMERLQLVDAGP
jgi:hypothetical protein